MDRRKFLKNSGVALGGTALYMAGHDVSPVAAEQQLAAHPLAQMARGEDLTAVPYLRSFKKEPVGYNSAEWGSDALPYMHTPTIEETYRQYSPHNMVFMCNYVVAIVMDREGNKYNLLRQLKAFDSITTHASRSVPDGVTMAQALFKPGEMYLGRCENDLIDNAIVAKPYLANPNLFNITMEAQKAHWTDVSGRVDLQYKALGPALEFYVPGLVEDNAYRSEPFWVKGTIEGKPVQGFGVIETAWGPAGTDWVQCKIFRYLEEHWMVWLNVFEDGSKEWGVFMSGVDNFGCSYFSQDGQVTLARRTDSNVVWTPDNFIQSANFTIGDKSFTFNTEARVVQAPGYLSWSSGTVRLDGDTRKPKMTLAWYEFLPKR